MAFVIGASGPKAPSTFARMVTILKNIVDEYDVSASKTHLALVDYNGLPANARVFFSDYSGYSKENFKIVAENIPGPGSRPGTLSDGLKKVRDEVFTLQGGERPFAEDILVVMTEGDFDENSKVITDAVAKLRDKPVKVIVIAITDEPDEDKYKVIASGNNLVVILKTGGDNEEAKKVPFIAAKGWLFINFLKRPAYKFLTQRQNSFHDILSSGQAVRVKECYLPLCFVLRLYELEISVIKLKQIALANQSVADCAFNQQNAKPPDFTSSRPDNGSVFPRASLPYLRF